MKFYCAAPICTTAVSAFSSGTGGNENDAASSGFTAELRAMLMKTVFVLPAFLLALHSALKNYLQSRACVALALCKHRFFIKVNNCTQPTEVLISVVKRKDVVKAGQSVTRSNTFKTLDSSLIRMLTLTTMSTKLRTQVKVNSSQVTVSQIRMEVNHHHCCFCHIHLVGVNKTKIQKVMRQVAPHKVGNLWWR